MKMATKYKQPVNANAAVLGNEPNIGVKGLRFRARSDSDALRTFDNPQENLSAAEKKSGGVAKQIWGSEDEAEILRKHENWKRARAKQAQDRAKVFNLQDAVKIAIFSLVFRAIVHKLGFSVRKISLTVILAWLAKSIYSLRAPARTFPPNGYTSYPILGQIEPIYHVLTKSGTVFQLERARELNFASNEGVLFAMPRETTLMDPRDREYMLKANWRNYVKNNEDGTGFQENFAEIMGRGIFAVDGDEWQDHRKVASHLFSANGLKSKMEVSFREHGKKLVKLLEPKAQSGVEFDFQDAMANLTFETICDIAFGVEPGAMDAGIGQGKKIDFLVRFDRVQQNSVLRFILPSVIWRFMRYLNIGSERVLREDAVELTKYVTNIIHKRRASGELENADDLLAMYVRTAKNSGKAYMMEDDYLMDAIMNFMVAGRDTTSCTLTNLFKLLPTNPEAEEKMLAELDRVVGRGNVVSWDHIRELKYCGAVFNEVLRMYPPVSVDSRFAVQDDVMPSGIHIEAGQRVTIMNTAVGRDPHLWSDPDSFLPERWIQPDKPTRRPDEYIFPVFWGGPRLCLGKDMARLEVISIAYDVLSKYRVQILPHSEKTVNGPVQFYEAGLPAKVSFREEIKEGV